MNDLSIIQTNYYTQQLYFRYRIYLATHIYIILSAIGLSLRFDRLSYSPFPTVPTKWNYSLNIPPAGSLSSDNSMQVITPQKLIIVIPSYSLTYLHIDLRHRLRFVCLWSSSLPISPAKEKNSREHRLSPSSIARGAK